MRLKIGAAGVRAVLPGVLGGVLAWRHYEGLPAVPPAPPPEPGGGIVQPPARVSIVIPARDEAGRLPALLASLQHLDYPVDAREIIVVDDGSSDGTAAVAAAGGARVIAGVPLPDGWTGKSFACHQGAQAAGGAWLLFADADTVHAPASLRAALAYAEREGLHALSLVTGQRCESTVERLMLPLAYAVLFAGTAPRRVNGTSTRRSVAPLANGQYILCQADAYRRAGGHAAVRASIIEDAALARALVDAGLRYRFARGESLVEVRMYSSLREIWAGFRKNSARYILDDPRRVAGAGLLSTGLSLALTSMLGPGRPRPFIALLAYTAGTAALVPWYRRFGVPAAYAALHPLGMAVLALITLDSTWRTVARRGASWKGRTYR